MKTKTILIKNSIIFTGGSSKKLLKGYDILIEDSKIKKIFKSASKNIKADKIINAEDKLIMPGFINVHMHFYSSFARGLNKINPSKDFVEVLNNLWWRLDKKLDYDAIYYSSMAALIQAIKKGTTTLIDHHASPFSIRGSLFEIEKAVRRCGLRACLCYEVSDRDGEKKALEGIKENYEFIKYSNEKNDNFIKSLFGLHASFTVSNKTLEIASDIGNSLNSGFHVHCAEAISDQIDCQKKHKMRVVERFEKFSILGEKTILAHCVHINEKEKEILRRTQTQIAVNSQSNANNAVGISDIIGFSQKEILYGLGTDAMTVNMMEEMRAALWLCHLKNSNPSVGFSEVTKTLENNVKIALKYFERIGEIKEGNFADIIMVDYRPTTPLKEDNFMGHLIFGISQSNIDTTIVNGNVLMEKGKLNFIDEKEVARKSEEKAKKIWNLF